MGDQWTYEVKHLGDKTVTTKSIIREDRFEGKVAYVIKAEDRELFYSKETLESLAETKDGKLINKRRDPSRDFSWPLTPGKRWRNVFAWEDLETKESHKVDRSVVVSGIEKVTVPAGTFLAARIQAYGRKSGHLMREYWYSSTTKWPVKLRDYSEFPFKEEELTSFKIN